MTDNHIATILTEALQPIMKSESSIKSTDLLRAYATFDAMAKIDPTALKASYEELARSDSVPRYAMLPIPAIVTEETLQKAYQEFQRYAVEDFLRFAVPDLSADVSGLLRFYQTELASDTLLLTHHLIQVRLLMFSTRSKASDASAKDIYEGGARHPDNAALERQYSLYTEQEKDPSLCLTYKQFCQLYRCINIYRINSDELKNQPRGYKTEELDELIDLLYNRLELSREQQIELCFRFYLENKQAKAFQAEEKLFPFFKLKDSSQRRKHFSSALRLLGKIPPIDALAAISVRRRIHDNGGTKFTERTYSPNDVPLENSLIYPLFTASVCPGGKSGPVTILLPSVFFVRKWLKDIMMKEVNVCFVFRSRYESEIVRFHYEEGSYGVLDGDYVTFTDLASWTDQLLSGARTMERGKLLAFFCGFAVEKQEEIYQLLYKTAATQELFLILGSYEFERARSPFAAALSDPRFCFNTIELLPQRINNSAHPKRKMIVRAEILAQPAGKKSEVAIAADELIIDQESQGVVRGTMERVYLDQTDLINLNESIRHLFWRVLLNNNGFGRRRTPAFSVPFTPDLTIWCSKSYPKNNGGRPRLEAYFTEILPPEKAERGVMDRGKALPQTKKRVSAISDEDIPSWIMEQYPFSSVSPRRSENGQVQSKVSVSVREEAIDYYTNILDGQNIAVKTFWYLYPNLEDQFSAKDYGRLTVMVTQTEIGWLRLQDITAEDVVEILESSFPKHAAEQYFLLLSRTVDKAVEYGYCSINVLGQTLRDRKKYDKLFSEVRQALTKKHFTQSEYRALYQIACEKLAQGQSEYIGVVLRILTGLGSNVICGLKWKDYVRVEDYGIKKLIITRQATNDGKAFRGFESKEDYLCFPCTSLLEKHLDEAYSLLTQQYPKVEDFEEWLIVRGNEDSDRRRRGQVIFPPRDLERLCKQLMTSLALPDHIITVPDQNDGTKETNLNAYGGDFFRENFRYWALRFAGMTNDETAYLIGNTPETTFGRFYCDYLNDASQYLMYIKLRRLDALLLGGEDAVISRRFLCEPILARYRSHSMSSCLQIQLTLPRNVDELEFEIESDQAVSLLIAPATEER